VDLHLEHGLRLHTTPEHKSLYSWAINEIDEQGQSVGRDQIPWPWTLRFTATSCILGDSIEINSRHEMDPTAPVKREITQGQVIRMELRPGIAREDGNFFRETTYRMFGTDRAIKAFQLDIHPLTDPAEQESCRAWDSASYTYETDFRNETAEDCIVFYLYVKPETFARYAAKIALGNVDEIIFSAGIVSGFYSEWSPSISTRNVKVLTSDDNHRVDLPPDLQFEPPRLGEVGDATLYINRRLEFGKRPPNPQRAGNPEVERKAEVQPMPVVPGTREVATDPQTVQMFKSLRRTT
jgi:hypothetical protein